MGIQTLGILGAVTGKVGPVVGAIWHGIPYFRAFKKPTDPQTAAQIAQRALMSKAVLVSQEYITDLIPALWNPVAVKMSGYNYFVQQNIDLLDATDGMDADSIASKGTLEASVISAATYEDGPNQVEVTFDGTPTGNGLATDSVYITVWDKSTGIGYAGAGTGTRTTGTSSLTIVGSLTATNLRAYLSFHRGTGSEFKVSDSVNDVCSAA